MKNIKNRETWSGYGILNAFGDPWTKKVFESVGEAERYMELFWGNMENPPDMSKHEIIVVEVSWLREQKKKKKKNNQSKPRLHSS